MTRIRTTGIKAVAVGLLSALVLTVGSTEIALGAVELNDWEISNAVDDEMIADSAVSASSIDVSTVEGIVTLTGSVNNILAKERAEKIAATIKGGAGHRQPD